MVESAISIENVSKRFVLRADRAGSIKEAFLRRGGAEDREFWALKDVSFEIPKGSFYGIIGHNGSGKSTLLRLIAGIHLPSTGSITASGRISALLELGSGFHPDLTGRENIFLNGAMLGLNRKQMAGAIDDIIEFSGIGAFIDSPVKVYSSGMHVRLGFAIAVHVDPEILLVDEVLAVGDEEFQRKCLDHIYSLRRSGTTIVLVSHAAGLMQSICDEVAWLDHGELQATGDPFDTIENYLARVNQQENARLATEDAQRAADTGKIQVDDAERRGSGEIRITSVEYLDSSGEPTQGVRSGDRVTMRLHFEAASTVRHPIFGVGVYHENGIHVAGPNNSIGGVEQPIIEPGSGHVDIVFDPLVLLPGRFYVTTGIYSPDQLHCYDSWDRNHQLIVQPGAGRERYGIVDLGARWTQATS